MANSTRRQSAAKSRLDGTIPRLSPSKKAKPPLWRHAATGQWCKKIRGRKHYFGTNQEAAIKEYLRVKDDLAAGREPSAPDDQRLTLKTLVNTFLTHKRHQVAVGELTARSFDDYLRSCETMVRELGKSTVVEQLRPEDLLAYRRKLGETRGVHALGNEITRARVVLRFAFESGLIQQPIRFGEFKRPKKSAFRRQRAAVGSRLLEPEQLRTIIEAADVQMLPMVLLGLNCGFGNADCGTLTIEAVDLATGWIDFPRPKTGIDRRCPLWTETIAALTTWLDMRKEKRDDHRQLVFVTKYGQPWHRDGAPGSPLSAEFRKLLDRLKLHRRGVSFYSLRHCFQTIADECGDYIATRRIMGHADHSISDSYRERFHDARLKKVVQHVRDWLFQSNANPEGGSQ